MSDDADTVLLLKAVSDALSPDELKEAFSNLAAAIKVSSISVSKSQVTDTALEKKAMGLVRCVFGSLEGPYRDFSSA